MFSVRIVDADFYVAAPIPQLDVCHSKFRDLPIRKVPVIRIYGATLSGQKACLHIHGIFPYIYVPYDGTQPTDKYIKQFATSVDFAVQVALGKASSSVQHVNEICVVKGKPYYGYHEGERDFLKISLYNPFLVTRVVSLLHNGAVMNKVYHPYEAHIPYLLQFFIDYNLHGMNLLHASSVRFRTPIRLTEGETGKINSYLTSLGSSPRTTSGTTQLWSENTVPSDCVLGSDVERLSFCELEVDVLASDILNKLEIGVNVGTNPGLAAIWEDEQQRRREANESSQISAPPSQERGLIVETETERRFKERIKEIIEERDMLIQSQMGKLGRDALSPHELSSLQDSISSLAASHKDLVAENSMDAADVVSLVLSQHVGASPAQGSGVSSSQIIDEAEPIVNQSIVQEVVEASQRSFSQELSSSLDKEMIDILASLAEESNLPSTQKTPLSQSVVLDQGDAESDEEAKDEEELSLDEESLMMSQRVWDDIEPPPAGSGNEPIGGVEENDVVSQRSFQYNLEGMSDTWTGSFLSGDIPQLDGAGDEESREPETPNAPTRNLSSRRAREGRQHLEDSKVLTDPSPSVVPRKNSRKIQSSKKTAVERTETSRTTNDFVDNSESTESLNKDVWPQKARVVRTYSKKYLSSLKFNRSPQLKENVSTLKDCGETSAGDVEEKMDCDDSFKLVLSESSDSEDSSSLGGTFGSKDSDDTLSKHATSVGKSKTKQGETQSRTLGNRGGHKSYTSVRTKFFDSPDKTSEAAKGRQGEDELLSLDMTPSLAGSSKDVEEQSGSHALDTKERESNFFRTSSRKRKLSVTEEKPQRRSERTIIRRTAQRTDALMCKDAVICAMRDLKVPLEDFSSTSQPLPKFVEAAARLRKRSESQTQEESCDGQGQRRSTVKKGRCLKRSAPLRAAKNRTSPLSKKGTSPRKKEKKMKNYGALPVVLQKSPIRNPTDTIQIEAKKSLVSQISFKSAGNSNEETRSGTGQGSSRQLPLDAVDDSKNESRSGKGNATSRQLSLESVGESRKSYRVEIGEALSLQKEGVKRKLTLDVDKDLQSTSAVLPGTRKKRKLSLELSLVRPRPTPKGERVEGSVVTATVGHMADQDPTAFKEGKSIRDGQEGRVVCSGKEMVEVNSSFVDSGDGLAFSGRYLDDVTCVPCSPVESEVSENSPECAGSPTDNKQSCFLSVPAKPEPSGVSASPSSPESKLHESSITDANDSGRSPEKPHFPPEKDSELFANALFNMSYPSPLPFDGAIHSPPCPSSPLETSGDMLDMKADQSMLQSAECFTPSISIATDVLKPAQGLTCSVSQVSSQGTDFTGGAVFSHQTAPQLGETQTAFESSLVKGSGLVETRRPSGYESGEIENASNVEISAREERILQVEQAEFGQVFNDDRMSFTDEERCSSMEEGVTDEIKDLGLRLEEGKRNIYEENSNEGKSVNHKESSEPAAGLESCGPVTEQPRREIDQPRGEIDQPRAEINQQQAVETSLPMQVSDLSNFSGSAEKELFAESEEMDLIVESTEPGDQLRKLIPTGEHPKQNTSAKDASLETKRDNMNLDTSSTEISKTDGVVLETSLVKPVRTSKDDTCCPRAMHELPSCSSLDTTNESRFWDGKTVVIEPLKRPPSSKDLLSTLKDHGLPQCRYKEPFCSDPDDIPGCTGEVGGRVLRVESNQVEKLPEFKSSSASQGLKHWRLIMAAAHENSFGAMCHETFEGATNVKTHVELQMALMGDDPIVITPCRGPPAPEAVKAWVRDKLSKRKAKELQEQKESLAPMETGQKQEISSVNKLEKLKEKLSGEGKVEVDATKPPETKDEEAPQKNREDERTTKSRGLSLPADNQLCVGNKKAAVVGFETGKKVDVVELSDNSVELTSPYNLFSPGVGGTSSCGLFSPGTEGTFTFASGPQKHVDRSSVHGSAHQSVMNAQNQREGLYSGTQPMNLEPQETDAVSGQRSETLPGHTKVFTGVGTGTINVTPSSSYSLEHEPQQTPVTTTLPLSPSLQTQKCPLSPRQPLFPPGAVYHSTPVASTSVHGVQSPTCTPIFGAAKGKRPVTKTEPTSKKETSSNQTPTLRRQLLTSQFKFVTPGSQPRHRMPWSSQIEGPSPNNTYGFKVTQMNLKDAKALHEIQHLTLLSLELHVRTRRGLRPDPEFDPICAIFYYIQTDTPLPCGKNRVTGVICVDEDSSKLRASETVSNERSVSNAENKGKSLLCTERVASTSAGDISVSSSTQKTTGLFHRPLFARSGVTDCDVQYVAEEKNLFPALIHIIRKWDPDILIGYEVQLCSWGFLLERALTFEIDLCPRLSRVKGAASESNMDAEKDRWGAAHTSEIKIAGRIILNVWRLMRHEVTLNRYTFENVAFHVLHERIPLFTFRTLSDWWDHRTALNRWRTVDHYVTRCRGNVRILESLDFIGRTSELARLFGILFFSVISRGSQYRVESMMLRIAKPMNYVAVSPSVNQVVAMRAPETIPLVMEPESRFYSDPVLVLDFQSLYPSMIIAYNYCFSTCLGRVSSLSEYGEFKFGATSMCVPPSVLKKLEGHIHVAPNGVAFVKPDVRKGVLPSMLDEILTTRIMVKNSMKRWKTDKALGRMLDARQLGLKLIANVTYGYTAAHFSGRMPCVEVGDTIVRKARETLERAIELVNNTPRWGARVVYGDTDSLFVLLKGVTKEQAFNIGRDIVDTVTAMNPKPVKLKFEKVYLPCVLQTKKRYVGYMYETLDQKEPVFDAKGIETVRRDGCPAVAKILEKSLRILFETRDVSLVKNFVQRQCTKLMQGRASLQDFTFGKEYRGMKNYKPGACVPALELTRRFLREDRRSEPRVGERVPYVVVYGSPGLPLIQLVRRPQEVLQDPGLRLNASYYITKQILPPLNRAFSLIGINVFMWYAVLPRVMRVVQGSSDQGDRKKGTISQYFVTMTCPVCQELSPTDLCSNCRAKPQLSAVTLANRVRSWERTHQHLAEICYNCCGSRDPRLCCVSLDCPVFHRLVHATRDMNSSQQLRRILDDL